MHASSAPFLPEIHSASAGMCESRSRHRPIFPSFTKNVSKTLLALVTCAMVIGCCGYFRAAIIELSDSPIIITWSLACSTDGGRTISNRTSANSLPVEDIYPAETVIQIWL